MNFLFYDSPVHLFIGLNKIIIIKRHQEPSPGAKEQSLYQFITCILTIKGHCVKLGKEAGFSISLSSIVASRSTRR
jgi:hypothetical protein